MMIPSIAGALVCCCLLILGWFAEGPIIVALLGSLAFGSTAIAQLPALGGASPLIHVVFLVALLGSVALRRNIVGELGAVFRRSPVTWVTLLLIVYTVVGALLLPRVFAGQTTVFVPQRLGGGSGGIVEIPLGPVTGNITQGLYFVLSALSFFAVSVLLLRPRTLEAIRRGFIALATLNVGLGLIDLLGKVAGVGDVLAPIRSASYAMLSGASVAGGFSRIVGGFPEASAFGAMSAALLVFTFLYWRYAGDWYALVLSIALLFLLVLSTSTTAYAALGVLGILLSASIVRDALRNRLQVKDLFLLVAGIVVVVVALGVALHNEHAFDPFMRMFESMVLDKSSSSSAQERAYWNYRSLETVFETVGLGIGLGSSRASSWIIAVISQLGIIGSIMVGYLTLHVFRGTQLVRTGGLDPQTRATVVSVSGAAVASLLAASISGSAADPGLIFFLALAVASSVRASLAQSWAPPVASDAWDFELSSRFTRT